METLEKHRDEELAERREKRKKAEETAKQDSETSATSEQKMEVKPMNSCRPGSFVSSVPRAVLSDEAIIQFVSKCLFFSF